MFVGWTSVPPLRKWKTARITTRATSMPNRRRSISVWANIDATDARAGGRAWVWPEAGATSATFATAALLVRALEKAAPPRNPGAQVHARMVSATCRQAVQRQDRRPCTDPL